MSKTWCCTVHGRKSWILFDLAQGPSFRAILMCHGGDDHALLASDAPHCVSTTGPRESCAGSSENITAHWPPGNRQCFFRSRSNTPIPRFGRNGTSRATTYQNSFLTGRRDARQPGEDRSCDGPARARGSKHTGVRGVRLLCRIPSLNRCGNSAAEKG